MTSVSADVGRRIDELDLSLFASILSQSSDDDKRSMLQLQRLTRRLKPSYTYLEIGSHLGGSIQPHLVDPACSRIFSIDPRPERQPDERGDEGDYEGNSTERMLDNLRRVAAHGIQKITCFDSDASDVDRASVIPAPDLCFIDGEHTNFAVVSDFAFCRSVCSRDSIVGFHDDWVVYKGLRAICRSFKNDNVPFTARKLPGSVFVIVMGAWSRDSHFHYLGQSGIRWLEMRRVEHWIDSSVPVPLRQGARNALHFVSTRLSG